MDKLAEVFEFVKQIFQWYFIVMPWEQSIKVRKGKNSKTLGPGMYFKIPFIDMIYIQTTRRRMVDVPIQTVTTKDGHTITIKSGLLYKIVDMYKLYNSIAQPECTMINLVMSNISTYVSSNNLVDINQTKLEEAIKLDKHQDEWGLGEVQVRLTNFAVVKTFRLIQDQTIHYSEGLKMDHLHSSGKK